MVNNIVLWNLFEILNLEILLSSFRNERLLLVQPHVDQLIGERFDFCVHILSFFGRGCMFDTNKDLDDHFNMRLTESNVCIFFYNCFTVSDLMLIRIIRSSFQCLMSEIVQEKICVLFRQCKSPLSTTICVMAILFIVTHTTLSYHSITSDCVAKCTS